MQEYAIFFRKGHAFFEEKDIHMEEMRGITEALKVHVKSVERKMQDRHAVVPKEIFQLPAGMPVDPQVVVEGYLFKLCKLKLMYNYGTF